MDMQRMMIAAGLMLSMALAGGQPAGALEIVDVKQAPDWYATEVISKDKDGKEVRTVTFSTVALAFSPHDFDRVLKAYGAEVVDGKTLPASHGTVSMSKDKDGKDVRTAAFATGPMGLTPEHVHAVLAAYGLKVTDGAKLPDTYGREVTVKDKDGKDVKQIVFVQGGAYAASPAHWNQVLSAYGR